VPAAYAVDTDSFLELGRAEVVVGDQGVAGVETDAVARLVLHQFDDVGSVKVGYKFTFTRFFYWPQPLRALEEI